MRQSRRLMVLCAGGLAAVAMTAAGCSSGGGTDSASPAPTDATSVPSPVTEPIVLSYGTARTTAAVGQAIDFDVEYQQGDWTIKSSDPKVVEVTPGSTNGTAITNPGGVAVAPGTAKVTLTLPGGGKIWFVEVTVA